MAAAAVAVTWPGINPTLECFLGCWAREVLRLRITSLVKCSIQVSRERPSCMEDVTCLPLSVVLSILQLLPQEAFIARLVNKASRLVFDEHRRIHANYADLPHWVLREFHSSLRSDFDRKQLLTARAGKGLLPHGLLPHSAMHASSCAVPV
jgi:hypothetical protein